jgi:hypothetical protein
VEDSKIQEEDILIREVNDTDRRFGFLEVEAQKRGYDIQCLQLIKGKRTDNSVNHKNA